MDAPDLKLAYELADKIRELSIEYGKIVLEISAARAAIVNRVLSEPSYWKNGKPPSMSLIEKTYLVTGIEGFDLLSLLKKKEEVKSKLDYYKMKLDIYKLEVEVWRTESANQRALN